jgi:single-strand DNA-binding protein
MYNRNRVDIIGHLGADPDLRRLDDQTPVASFSVAMTERWNGDEGEKQERTEWVRVTAFGKKAEIVGKYLKKGSYVSVEGSLRTRRYDKDGVAHFATEVRANNIGFLDRKTSEMPVRDDGPDQGSSATVVEADFDRRSAVADVLQKLSSGDAK